MIRRPVIVVAIAFGSLAATDVEAQSPRSGSSSASQLEHRRVGERLRSIHQRSTSHQRRIEQISALFMGKPFALSPLGEGPTGGVDSDPIVRFDRFDCVTYVEEVMALAWHANLDDAVEELQRVRYTDGQIRYGARKHIMMAQWIPLNVRAGFVHDVTRKVGGNATRAATLQISERDFRSKKGRALKLGGADQPRGSHRVDMVPLAHMAEAIDRVPAGTIITTIRQPQTGVPYRASHVGLVIVQDGKRMIRHAHRPSGRVVEQPLARFVAAARRFRSWPVVGFNLLAIALRPPARATQRDAGSEASGDVAPEARVR